MYKFVANIGKEGRQALQQVEFAIPFGECAHPGYHLLKLGDCINLQRLQIGVDHWMIKDRRLLNYQN